MPDALSEEKPSEGDNSRIDVSGPLSRWTAEQVCSWPNWQNKLKTASPWLNAQDGDLEDRILTNNGILANNGIESVSELKEMKS
jgi:hypothetical protein